MTPIKQYSPSVLHDLVPMPVARCGPSELADGSGTRPSHTLHGQIRALGGDTCGPGRDHCLGGPGPRAPVSALHVGLELLGDCLERGPRLDAGPLPAGLHEQGQGLGRKARFGETVSGLQVCAEGVGRDISIRLLA